MKRQLFKKYLAFSIYLFCKKALKKLHIPKKHPVMTSQCEYVIQRNARQVNETKKMLCDINNGIKPNYSFLQ